MLNSEGDFNDGLREWLTGVDSPEAETAGCILAETILLHRKWILSHKSGKKGKK